VLNYAQTRTGNVLLRQNVFASPGNRFDESYAMHGEDRNFFKRMIAQGQTYVWCEEAAVYETEPPERCRATYHIRRALIRGGLAWRHATRRKLLLLKSVAGFGLYMLALPFLLFGGTGLFMRYFIKSCDHLGCLCAFVGLHMDKILQTP
jgi:cellulose synthase/poly-beta-1,6-N-acetylglucosamine synthase-like glycosyltransferase